MAEETVRLPRVSVVVPVRGDEPNIGKCLRSVLGGTLSEHQLELIVVDGGSSESTMQVVARLAAEHPCLRIVQNPERITPSGLNAGIRSSKGQAICILSAHSYLDADYLEKCLAALEQQQVDVAGGPMVTLSSVKGIQSGIVGAITSSKFGMGSSFRNVRKDGPVDTVVFGVYRRDVFERVGLFDERLVRNQDNELNSRLRSRGGTVWMVASTESYYYSRQDLPRLLRQNFRNGMYCILTWRLNPSSFAMRHAIPLFFALFLILGGVATWFVPLWGYFYVGVVAVYAGLAALASLQIGLRTKSMLAFLLPPAFAALHICYGLGSLVGIVRFIPRRLERRAPEKLISAERSDQRP
jgi:cellulose synthase/poly-beta-1,6-N-acetylglucosamine synthase-like glycosyltransferase